MSLSRASSKKTIAIIGAGISGLQAARTILLHPNSDAFNVIILEARNRIGGRVHTKLLWSSQIDFGIFYSPSKLTYEVPTSFMGRTEIC